MSKERLESALEWVKKFGHTEVGWAARVLAKELELRPKAVGFNLGHASRGGIMGEPLSSLMVVDPGQVIDVRLEFDSYFLDIKAATVVECHKGTAKVRVDHMTGDPNPVITVTSVNLKPDV